MKIKVAFSVAIVTLVVEAFAHQAVAANVTGILSASRAAMGGNAINKVTSFHESGSLNIAGVKGKFEQWSDAASGAYASSDDAGPFAGANGFDGNDVWNQDATGLVWVEGGKAGRYSVIAQEYLINGDLWRPDRRGVVSIVGHRTESGKTYDVLSATPPNGLPLQIWLDAKTHLPARAVVTVGEQSSTTTFADFRRVAGLQVPFHERTISNTGNEIDALVTAASANPPDVKAHLVKPASHVADYSISQGTETTVPIELVDNHVYISVTLNGKGPYQFAFDTGGSNLLDAGAARALGLTTSGAMQSSGVGAQTEGASFAKVATLGIGHATIANQYFVVLPIRQGFSVAGGVPIDGLIGFEVLARFITTFDYDKLKVTLRMPSAGSANAVGADAIPFVFYDTIPQVACQLDGISGDCSVDTGSRASVSLLTPFVAAHPSLVPTDATAIGVNGFGVGGPAFGRLGRLRTLQIGKTSIDDLIGDFSAQKRGFFANPFIAANVGGGVWKRFTVTFDYQHQTMSLVPNAHFAKRDESDRTGLFVIETGGQATVLDARPGTPAAQAGLARGDVITAIDGAPTAGMDLLHVRRALSGAAGKSIRLTVQPKGGQKHDVTLILRDYV